MNRRELLATYGTAMTAGLAGCGGEEANGPSDTEIPGGDAVSAEADSWPMFHQNRSNARCFADESVGDVTDSSVSVRWSYEPDGAVWSSPVIANETLYVGCYDRYLYAIDTESGDLRWRYRTGDRIDGSPAVANGTVYVGSFDRNVYALDANTGEEQWIRGMRGIVRSSPTVHDGVVYIGAFCRTEECSAFYNARWPARGFLYALDADTGSQLWRYETGDGVISNPAVTDDTVFFGGSDNNIYALDEATGEERWARETTGAVMSSPMVVDGRLVVGDVVGELYAIDADSGAIEWRYGAGENHPTDADINVVITGTPVHCRDTIYVGTVVPAPDGAFGELHAVSMNGARRWIRSPFGEAIGSSATVVNGVLYFGAHTFSSGSDAERGVYALDHDGTERWSYTVGSGGHRGFGSSPAIVDGTLYIGSAGGAVYAFDLD